MQGRRHGTVEPRGRPRDRVAQPLPRSRRATARERRVRPADRARCGGDLWSGPGRRRCGAHGRTRRDPRPGARRGVGAPAAEARGPAGGGPHDRVPPRGGRPGTGRPRSGRPRPPRRPACRLGVGGDRVRRVCAHRERGGRRAARLAAVGRRRSGLGPGLGGGPARRRTAGHGGGAGAGACAASTRARPRVLLLVGLAAALPVPVVDHLGSPDEGGSSVSAMVVHVGAMLLWSGGLTGIVVHLRSDRAALATALPGFSRLALGAYVSLVGSGLVVLGAALPFAAGGLGGRLEQRVRRHRPGEGRGAGRAGCAGRPAAPTGAAADRAGGATVLRTPGGSRGGPDGGRCRSRLGPGPHPARLPARRPSTGAGTPDGLSATGLAAPLAAGRPGAGRARRRRRGVPPRARPRPDLGPRLAPPPDLVLRHRRGHGRSRPLLGRRRVRAAAAQRAPRPAPRPAPRGADAAAARSPGGAAGAQGRRGGRRPSGGRDTRHRGGRDLRPASGRAADPRAAPVPPLPVVAPAAAGRGGGLRPPPALAAAGRCGRPARATSGAGRAGCSRWWCAWRRWRFDS